MSLFIEKLLTNNGKVVGSAEKYPKLDKKTVNNLIDKYQQSNCEKSLEQIVKANMIHVIQCASMYRCDKIPMEDLVQEGCIGMMKALKNFDTSRGFVFFTYAKGYVLKELLNYTRRNYFSFKTTESNDMRKLFNNIRKFHDINTTMTIEKAKQIAKDLNVKNYEDVITAANYFHPSTRSVSTNIQVKGANDDSDDCLLQDTIKAKENTVESVAKEVFDEDIQKAIKTLSKREQMVIRRTYLNKEIVSMSDIARETNISPQAIYQVNRSAIKKLKTFLADLGYTSRVVV